MSAIRELSEFWTIRGRIINLLVAVIRLAVKTRRFLAGTIKKKAAGPVFGYTKGTDRELKKRALITYVAAPFSADPAAPAKVDHSNKLQSIEIAKAFNRLGYAVDIVDWLDTTSIPPGKYDVFFGMHYNFERLLPYAGKNTVKIYYATGAYWAFEIAAERARIEALENRRGVKIDLPIRLRENNWVQIADATIVMGNQFVLETYPKPNERLFAIDNSVIPTGATNIESKDFSAARRNFLWFGSTGLLHKGLDLVLEAFSEIDDIDLWVCGPLRSADEQEFVKIYRRELFHKPNIHPIGWTDIHSDKFKMLADKCAYTILASCAEGMAGGVLVCMGRGLIPVVSKETGVDTENFGVTLKDNSVDEIRRVIIEMANKSPEVCRTMAREALTRAHTRYSPASFGPNIEQILVTILDRQ